jgi:hypothetical protein
MSSESDLDPPRESGWLPVVLACLAVLFTLAALVGRDDPVDDLDVERALDWLVIGPLWGAVAYFHIRSRREVRRGGRVIAGGIALAAWLLISLGSQWWTDRQGEARLEVPRKMCLHNMNRVVMGLKSYASSHDGYLPPAYQVDEEGRPMRSWRAQIAANELAVARDVAESETDLFCCLSRKGETSFLAVVGPKTAFPGSKPASRRRLSPRTILFVAVKNSGIKWLEPRDLTVEEAIRALRGYGWLRITHIAFADGEILPVSEIANLDGLEQQLRAVGAGE